MKENLRIMSMKQSPKIYYVLIHYQIIFFLQIHLEELDLETKRFW